MSRARWLKLGIQLTNNASFGFIVHDVKAATTQQYPCWNEKMRIGQESCWWWRNKWHDRIAYLLARINELLQNSCWYLTRACQWNKIKSVIFMLRSSWLACFDSQYFAAASYLPRLHHLSGCIAIFSPSCKAATYPVMLSWLMFLFSLLSFCSLCRKDENRTGESPAKICPSCTQDSTQLFYQEHACKMYRLKVWPVQSLVVV